MLAGQDAALVVSEVALVVPEALTLAGQDAALVVSEALSPVR
jgi:hypothetical protein